MAVLQHFAVTDHLVDGPEAERRHDLARFFGHQEQVVDDVFGLAAEQLSQRGVLRGDANRAGVEVTLPHHDATERDQRGGGKAELFGSQQAGDHDIAARLELAVRFQADSTAQVVQNERLMSFGDAQFPRHPGVLDARQG